MHGHHEKDKLKVGCAVVTVSDTRTEATDTSGARIQELVRAAGHEIAAYRIVPDDPGLIRDALAPILTNPGVGVVFLTGGTGIASRDTTFEAVRALFEKEIEGFGELFRMLSFEAIGPAAMLSRACAGIVAGKAVFSIPGSTAAVELALTRLALPQLGHIARLLEGR
jgi:molybdenum cofactor biosynthesis protein B